MQLRNLMESLVDTALEETMTRNPEACGCERCRLDAKAIALNNLPARYVVDEPGEVHRHLESITAPMRGDVAYTVNMAMQLVGARPHHAASAFGRRAID